MANIVKPKVPRIYYGHPLSVGLVRAFPLHQEVGNSSLELKARELSGFQGSGLTYEYKEGNVIPRFNATCAFSFQGTELSFPFSYYWRGAIYSAAGGEVFALGETSTTNYSGAWVSLSSGRLFAHIGDGGGTGAPNRRSHKSDTTPVLGDMYSFAVVWRSATDIDMYLNGAPETYASSGTGSSVASSNYADTIGGSLIGGSYGFGDTAATVLYLWNREITASEVLRLHNNPYELLEGSRLYIQTPSTIASLSTVQVSWTDESGGYADRYHIERAPDSVGSPGVWAEIDTVNHPTLTYDDTGLAAGTYWYRVRAYNIEAAKYSNYSGQSSITVT